MVIMGRVLSCTVNTSKNLQERNITTMDVRLYPMRASCSTTTHSSMQVKFKIWKCSIYFDHYHLPKQDRDLTHLVHNEPDPDTATPLHAMFSALL
jgi:hypothetical protein